MEISKPAPPLPWEFGFQTKRVFYYVNQKEDVGSGRWRESFRAKIQVDEKSLDNVIAKRYYSDANLQSHLRDLQVQCVVARLLKKFQLHIADSPVDLPGWERVQVLVSEMRASDSEIFFMLFSHFTLRVPNWPYMSRSHTMPWSIHLCVCLATSMCKIYGYLKSTLKVLTLPTSQPLDTCLLQRLARVCTFPRLHTMTSCTLGRTGPMTAMVVVCVLAASKGSKEPCAVCKLSTLGVCLKLQACCNMMSKLTRHLSIR